MFEDDSNVEYHDPWFYDFLTPVTDHTEPTKPRALSISTDYPRLPPELECKIFLIALRNNFGDVANLILTAKRVHDWIIPRAFEVVILKAGRKFPVPFTLEKFKKYGLYIRSLSLTQSGFDDSFFAECMSYCPNITNLLIRMPCFNANPAPLQNSLAVLPLTRLIVHVRSILSTPPPPQLLKVFTNITHLHLYGAFVPSYTPNSNPPCLRPLFPNLTYLSFFTTKITRTSD
ncbi:hypothetical protein BDN72DRAFT_965719 [Pluteus cervinus]|uniref:Uncharacterized protein n=1 Tax=Pluteus cervinus TaxID=181527 RepID=A0ACD3A4M2_9AGAR|nr:hypothetical protein BDN72DRAFT_965719 [Pluteus cervinus]